MSKESFKDVIKEIGIAPPNQKLRKTAQQSAAFLPPDAGNDQPFIDKDKHARNGTDSRRLTELLRRKPQDTLDLHGMTAAEAHEEVENFLQNQIAYGHKHVEIVHGKGVHAPEGRAVLRTKVRKWLSGCEAVLGYTTPSGNSGSMHVLLRKK